MTTEYRNFKEEIVFVDDGDVFVGCKFTDCVLVPVSDDANVKLQECVMESGGKSPHFAKMLSLELE